ncbi:MAG TPA: biotin--[acetyl-CoA-carboxylase] ligase [Pirellulales bacterium]|jgi:BirA family biotin operon repressor/biotin-[acetyl-CoA-carboxylase] ligase|nr:biotin--[acetyl-CoA-carboxylase] ligase [Pirellulales bacterium]
MSDYDRDVLASAPVDRVEYQPTLSSTSDCARELAAELAAGETLLVVADEQTAGRGRGSNRWWTGPGSMAFSVLFHPLERGIERRYTAMIALAVAVAICEVVCRRLMGHSVGLHWPNDVYVGDQKLAGILVEALPDGRHIVGVGVNVNNSACDAPPELHRLVATMTDLAGDRFDRSELLVELLQEFNIALQVLATAPQELGRQSDRLCLQHGKQLTIDLAGQRHTGRCIGIADDGALVLDVAGVHQRLYSGVLVKPSA